MAQTFTSEREFEDAIVSVLTNEKGWTGGMLNHPSEQDLVDNWARILFGRNNVPDRLNGCPLNEDEKGQLLEQVRRCGTPAEANGFINGGSVTVKRSNLDDAFNYGREVSLKIYDRLEVAGGESVYQVARQPMFSARNSMYPDRRGDLLLLINGLPVIHIELKRSGIPVSQAVNQIEKYLYEGVFTGFFQLVQIFVAMSPEETLYFANPGTGSIQGGGHINDRFLFHWEDRDNEPVNEWTCITEQLLSIPMAHMMVGSYTVADSGDGQLKVMRSYQCRAVQAINDKIKDTVWDVGRPEGGYVWHTTGSGKTLTSFKAAQLAAGSKRVDKVVFLVDRIELGTQSLSSYRAFADPRETVHGTENTHALLGLMLSDYPDETLIVTSIQKMGILCKELASKSNLERISRKKVVIIVDECHRSTFGETMAEIKENLPHALLIGFSGTPIEEENKHRGLTTADLFGDELARYTMADGIRDGNVLGFDVTQKSTYDDEELREAVALAKVRATNAVDVLNDPRKLKVYNHYMHDVSMKEIEAEVPVAQYDCEKHRLMVVDDIVDHWTMLSSGGKFHALFATSSIPEAIEYYRLFKELAPGLKVTALFDPSDSNTGADIYKETGIAEILEDYDKHFDKDFVISTYPSFKEDVAARLAHKQPYLHIDKHPNQELDLLIVVDQMLTGYDSKWLNTLYLDKVLRYEQVIQAFSRTNRLFGPEKPFGSIRYYRKPHTMKENIDAAVKTYSGDRIQGVFVDKLEKNLTAMNDLFMQIKHLFEGEGIEDFARCPEDPAACKEFVKLFNRLGAKLESARLQGFSFEELTYCFDAEDCIEQVIIEFNEDTYLVLAMRYKELSSSSGGGGVGGLPYDVDAHLATLDTTRIDSEYMESKFKKWMALRDANSDPSEIEKALNDLHTEFAKLSAKDQAHAERVIRDFQDGKLETHDNWDFRDYINLYRKNEEESRIVAFVEAFGVDYEKLHELVKSHPDEASINAHGRYNRLLQDVDIGRARAYMAKIAGRTVRAPDANRIVDTLLRRAITQDLFNLDEALEKELNKDAGVQQQ